MCFQFQIEYENGTQDNIGKLLKELKVEVLSECSDEAPQDHMDEVYKLDVNNMFKMFAAETLFGVKINETFHF